MILKTFFSTKNPQDSWLIFLAEVFLFCDFRTMIKWDSTVKGKSLYYVELHWPDFSGLFENQERMK